MADRSKPFRRLWVALLFSLLGAGVVAADVVVRRDGSRIEGRVLSVDLDVLVLETEDGRYRVDREQISEVRFARTAPSVRVEIRNVESDDALDAFLEGEWVLREGRRGGEWIDLTSKLKDGNNALRFRIHNSRGSWAYRVALRLNGEVKILSCGTPHRTDDPCRDFGHSGIESGTIEDIPTVWIHVDRDAGRVEVLP